MPRRQAALIASYPFGSSGANAALQWVVKKGAKLQGRVESTDVDLTGIALEVSPDGTTWNATTVANNGQAVTNATAVAGGTFDFDIRLRPGLDNYLRFRATGGSGILEIAGDSVLDIQKV